MMWSAELILRQLDAFRSRAIFFPPFPPTREKGLGEVKIRTMEKGGKRLDGLYYLYI